MPAIENLKKIKAMDDMSFSASLTMTNVAPQRRVTKSKITSDLYLVLIVFILK
jgi:hypothetical protein